MTHDSKTVHCSIHGERDPTYVCSHLLGDGVSLGFNRENPTTEDPFPDAWCDNCEINRESHGGWNEESEKLVKISLLCSGCYNRARIRNTRTQVTLDDLAGLRWKCGTCDEWHHGPCLDFAYDRPYYWSDANEKESTRSMLGSIFSKKSKSFLNEDYCSIDDEHFFVRGILSLPIIGTAESFRWGVWGSLSRENFKLLLAHENNPAGEDMPSMFSWLSSSIPEYPETLSLKMYAHHRASGLRPEFELEHTQHPLSQEYHHGITPQRVKEIMARRLGSSAG